MALSGAPRLALSLVVLLAMATGGARAQTPPPASSKPASARLLKGPTAVRGLPFFGQNAIAALSGEYAVGQRRVKVWSCRSPVFYSPAWKPTQTDLGASTRAFLLARPEGPVLAFSAGSFTLFVELPADSPSLRRFSVALERRFAVFFVNAASDAELSFPAFVEYVP